MPGEAGKLLFKEYKLSDQPAAARAWGKEGGKAGKGTPKTGRRQEGVKKNGGGGPGGSPLE